MKLKNLSVQVVVITGATSGIGLTTARMAALNGASLVLVARNEAALRTLCDEINENGGRAVYKTADVANESALREAAKLAIDTYGRIDTWVNNAGASIYGRIMDVPTEDLRRVFETNVWGVVNGSRIAVEYLRDRGGAIVNVGSEVSDAPVPLQGIYSASKHAVKGFTDALRMELEADGLPISVSLIKPTAIHTPFVENAKNHLPYEPQLPSPVYAPELVAEGILYCAENPKRDFFIGELAKVHSSFALNAPRLYDTMNEKMIDSMQNSGKPAVINRKDGLYETNSKLNERGSGDRFVLEESIYQRANIHPLITTAVVLGGGLAVAAYIASKTKRTNGSNGRATPRLNGRVDDSGRLNAHREDNYMEKVERSITVDVPIRTAYDQWTQFEDFPKFMSAVENVRQEGDSHLFWSATIGGKTVDWEAEIIEQVPDNRIAWESTTGARNSGVVSFESAGDSQTRVSLLLEYEPEGFVENVGSTMGLVGSRVESDLKRFKEFIENRQTETGAWRGEIGTAADAK